MSKLLLAALIAFAPCAAFAEGPSTPVNTSSQPMPEAPAIPAPPAKTALSVTPAQLQALRYFVNLGVKAVGVEQGSQVPRAAAELADLLDAAMRSAAAETGQAPR